ncbi:MAG TPA: hypothetical protein DDW62_04415 [Marinilabiliaceae bacterium]|jgi:hypothetical protein|nr:hypothetical protein [Marinilabiliaceae bacterium]
MKHRLKLLSLLLILLSVSFIACDDDDDDKELSVDSELIIGEWKVEKLSTKMTITTEGSGESYTSISEPVATMVFYEDGSGVSYNTVEEEVNEVAFEWSVEAQNLRIDFETEGGGGNPGGNMPGPGSEFSFTMDDMTAIPALPLEVTKINDEIMNAKYLSNYANSPVKIEMIIELSRVNSIN